ncbi:MAG: hypothetical protein DSY58_03995 [Desulfobulbus sp.]|nr:MAG: hypothetical protein DSY58_03995 [Desulfobulbus sp.]RUM38287.1 MAG: hypothetical protein DSY70_08140 [Desulfobulbus sp.]
MYQSLLPTVKPLIFEGKSGVLQIDYKYNDTAKLYVKEGIIEQVETHSQKGKRAASMCMQWLSFTTSFKEGAQGEYTLDPEIDTMSLLSFLEKTAKNIDVINNNIPSNDTIYRVDTDKLNAAKNLNAKDLKVALLFDGQRSLTNIIPLSGQSELALLTRTCRLILAGVAMEGASKNILPDHERGVFLDGLNDKLMDMVGPAASVLIDDAFDEIQASPESLAKEDLTPLLNTIGSQLEDDEATALIQWGAEYI